MTTTTMADQENQVFEANVRRAYSDFRNALITAKSELATRAGEMALKAVLDPKDTVSRDEAVRMKDEHSALDLVLDRLDSDWRHQESLLKFTEAARRTIASHVDWYRQEAGQYALKIVGIEPETESYVKGRAQVVRAHQYTLVHERWLAKFDVLFGPLRKAAGA